MPITKYQHLKNEEERANQDFMLIGDDGKGNYLVLNTNNKNIYQVTVENDKVISCECPHHIYRNCICKHMFYVCKTFGYEVDELYTYKNI